jgi:hypothetical protein
MFAPFAQGTTRQETAPRTIPPTKKEYYQFDLPAVAARIPSDFFDLRHEAVE